MIFFSEKIEDAAIFDTIEKSVKTGTKDVILFNIDTKSGETSERIVDILMRVFNGKRGYYEEVFWIAELEKNLDDKGLFESFKQEFKNINGNRWEDIRDQYSFEQDNIIEALTQCGFQSREASKRMFESDGKHYRLTPESFAKAVEEYCSSKGDNHQVIFLIDEIGMYIGDNSPLMLNLQSVAEELGTQVKGKAWIIVTSPADIEAALKGIKIKGAKHDFSQIQARFDTRVSLSSANVDEVIKKRILKKKEEHQAMLSLFYEEKKIILKNLISFSQGSAEMKNYGHPEDFISVYPFVPYQFNVLQKVFEKIRTTGFTGKHLAKGERSMLNAYKDSAEKYGDCDVGTLVPFYSFYDTIESFLDPIIIRTISQADENSNLEDFDCLILKTLFMIRHVKELQPNLDNIVVLSLTKIDEDKLRLRETVAASLNRLERETLISKSGDTFHFLTNEEQEINREIKNIDIDSHIIVQEIYNEVFDSNNVCQKSYGEYKFNKAVDDKIKNISDSDITIKFLTPEFDDYPRGCTQQSLGGSNLSDIESKDTLLFVFPENSSFPSQIKAYLQIDKYLRQNSSNRNDELIQRVLLEKAQESEKLKKLSITAISEGVKNAKVFIDGVEVAIGSGSPKDRVKDGYEKLVHNVYSKSHYVTREFDSEQDIIRLLKSDDLEKFGFGRSEANTLALNEMLSYISIKEERKIPIVLSELRSHFMKKPYGWKNYTISGLLATLFMSEDIKLRYQKTYLSSNPEEITKYLARKENYDKVIIEVRKRTGIEIIQNVKAVLREVFDRTAVPEKETELFTTAKDTLDSEKDRLSTINAKYSEEPRYPGKEQINNYNRTLKDILAISDPELFLKTLSDEKDELVGLHKEAEPALIFFDGVQHSRFKSILEKINNYRRNEQFLNEEAKRSLAEIESIISSDEPYSEIKNFPYLEGVIESSLADSRAQLKEEYSNTMELYKKELKDKFTYALKSPGYIDECLTETFDASLKQVSQSLDCSSIKLKIGDLKELYEQAHAKIEGRVSHENKGTTSGVGFVKEVNTKIVKDTSIFKTTKTIESERDLEEYISEIRNRLQALLKNNKIQVI